MAADRRALLGDDTIAAIHERVSQAPAPSPELVAHLRRILAPTAAASRPSQDESTDRAA